MARTGIVESDVAAAIDSLVEAGLPNPSIRMIRQKLGTGSLTTISRFKRSIESERGQTDGQGLPDPVVEQLSTIAGNIWSELSEAADALIANYKGEADKAIEASVSEAEKSQADLQRSHERASELESELTKQRARIEALESAIINADKNAQQRDIESARSDEQIKGLQSLISAKDDELARVKKSLQLAHTDIKQWQEKHTQSLESHDKDRNRWEKGSKTLEAERAAVQQKVAAQESATLALKMQIKATQTLVDDITIERNELRVQRKADEKALRTQAKTIGIHESTIEALKDKDKTSLTQWRAVVSAKDDQIKQLAASAQRTVKKRTKGES